MYETVNNLRVTLSDATDGGKLATIDGGVSASCIGNVTLTTVQPIRIPTGAQCPTAGLVAVHRDDGASGKVQFNADGGVLIAEPVPVTVSSRVRREGRRPERIREEEDEYKMEGCFCGAACGVARGGMHVSEGMGLPPECISRHTPLSSKKAVVLAFEDLRKNENSNNTLLCLIPLFPFGWQDLNVPEASAVHVASGLWINYKSREDLAKALATELKNTRILGGA